MNRKLKFRLGLGVALVLLSAIVVLYFYVYQSHRDIDAEKAAFETSVSELSQRFLNNPDSSTVTYADQTISRYGNVTALDLKQNTITLDNKLIATTSKDQMNSAKMGELVKLKGRFIGYDELFNELRMDQCTIEE